MEQTMSEVNTCRTCGAPIFWLKHERTQKAAPIDARTDPSGNIRIDLVTRTYRMASASERETHKDWLHTNHFMTCPDAPHWKAHGSIRDTREVQHGE